MGGFNETNLKKADVHHEICAIYRKNTVIDDDVLQWYYICKNKDGWTNIHNKNLLARLDNDGLGQTIEEKFEKPDGVNIKS